MANAEGTAQPTHVNLRAGTVHQSTPGCFQQNEPVFAMPKHGNKVTRFTTGKELFADIAKAIQSAKRFILFTDWQMDYDVELIGRGSADYHGRFSELLAKKVAEGVEVKVLLYDSVEAAVYTHENQVRDNLMKLNPKVNELGRNGAPARNSAGNLPVEVALQHPATGRAVENILFSHHQKSIVIDGTIAYIGGMDITYGRWCDNNFDVVADPVKHRINDLYNPGLSPGRLLTKDEELLTQDWAFQGKPANAIFGVARPGFAPPYYLITVLKERMKDILQRGYTLQQIEDLVQLMQIDDQIRDYLAQKARELLALTQAIERTLNRYSDAKRAAADKLMKGQVWEAVKGSVNADIQLASVAFRKLKQAFDCIIDAISDYVNSKINDFRHWFDQSMTDLQDDLTRFQEYAKNPELMVTDAKRLWQDIMDLPSQLIDSFVLEEGCQPRMPWQDVHCRIDGPAAHDVFANFVRRWNVAVLDQRDNTAKGVDPRTGLDYKVKPLTSEWLARWGSVEKVFGDLSRHGTAGTVSVQIARSMAHDLLQKEAAHAALLPLPQLCGKAAATADGYANNTVSGERHMDGILEAMIHAIRKAEAYIYMESQFFISDCGKSDNFEDAIAKNPLIAELANRIGRAVQKQTPFHVYVVLPVHPEGNLADGGVAKQHYWALQSIKRGRNSLIRRVCDYIARKQHNVKPGSDPKDQDVDALVDSGAWRDYLTFLNLRSWGLTAWFNRDPESRRREDTKPPKGQFVVTEQIYVHSKLTIVDDAIAIIGSANCNDRSLQGNGDTEIAAVIVDNDIQPLDLGTGKLINTRRFARELRQALWKKHLGLSIEDQEYSRGDRALYRSDGRTEAPLKSDPAYPQGAYTHLYHPPRRQAQSTAKVNGIQLSKPASPATWKAIQALARSNAKAYEQVFQHTPRDSMKYFDETENGWPRRLSRAVVAARYGVPFAERITKRELPATAKKQADKAAANPLLVTDFGTIPPMLTEGYMTQARAGQNDVYKDFHIGPQQLRGKVHDLQGALDFLSSNLGGFWVEMPLNFGSMQRDVWLKGRLGATAVAQHEAPERTEPVLIAASNQALPQEEAKETT